MADIAGVIKAETQLRSKAAPGALPVLVEIRDLAARHVVMTGDFTGWALNRYPMRRDADGVWRLRLHLRPGRYEYRLRVDGEWRDDPAAAGTVSNPFGGVNAVMTVPEPKQD